MDFHTIESCLQGELRSDLVLLDDGGQFRGIQCARFHEGLETALGEGIAFRLDGRGRDRQRVARLQVRVRDAAHVPQLQEDAAALGVDGVGDLLPAGHVRFVVDARGPGVTLALWRDLGGLGDDQAGAGALGIVFGRQFGGHVARLGAAAGERRHDDAVLQLHRTQLHGLEEVTVKMGIGIGVGHADPFLLAFDGMNCVDLATDHGGGGSVPEKVHSLEGNAQPCRRSLRLCWPAMFSVKSAPARAPGGSAHPGAQRGWPRPTGVHGPGRRSHVWLPRRA